MGKLNFHHSPPLHRRCGKQVAGQYDTTDDEPFWHCWECDQSFTLGGDPAFHMTSVPQAAARGADRRRA